MDMQQLVKAEFDEELIMGDGILLENAAINEAVDRFTPFMFSRFTIEPGKDTGVDQHAAKEMWVIGTGQGILTYDGAVSDVKKGDFLLFDSHKQHSIRNTGIETLEIYSVWWSE